VDERRKNYFLDFIFPIINPKIDPHIKNGIEIIIQIKIYDLMKPVWYREEAEEDFN